MVLDFFQVFQNLDREIIQFMNDNLGHSKESYYDVHFLAGDKLFKGGVAMVLYWFAWFSNNLGDEAVKRTRLLSALIGSMFAMGISRGLTAVLPFHRRPLFDSSLHYFDFPIDEFGFDKLSSFPSDHAVMFTSLSVGLYFISRKIGLFALCYSFLFILVPRVYLGYHWPSDILAGMVIGALAMIAFAGSAWVNRLIRKYSEPLLAKSPAIFYGLLFLLCYQIADMFDASREVGGFVKHLIGMTD